MNKFLQSAVERFPKDLEKSLIHPISRTDAEIIIEVIEIIKKTGLTEIKALLDQYKYLKDTEIYNQLQDWNLKHPLLVQEEKGEKKEEKVRDGFGFLFKRSFIYFKDLRIDVFNIRCYEKSDEYNFVKNEMEYEIIFNRLPESTNVTNVTTHRVIKYSDIEKRDRDFEALDSFMENFEGIKFINKKNE